MTVILRPYPKNLLYGHVADALPKGNPRLGVRFRSCAHLRGYIIDALLDIFEAPAMEVIQFFTFIDLHPHCRVRVISRLWMGRINSSGVRPGCPSHASRVRGAASSRWSALRVRWA